MFEERQRFSPALFTGLALICAAVPLVAGLTAPGADWTAIATAVLLMPLVPIALFVLLRLDTQVDSSGLDVRLRPFGISRRIDREQIKTAEVVTYRPLRDFGGWGVRFSAAGRMYSAAGDRAVKIVTADGAATFIGSAQPEALLAALRR